MRDRLLKLLKRVFNREITAEKALEELTYLPFEDIDFAKLDYHRPLRKHFPEVIYGPGKTLDELEHILSSFIAKKVSTLVTKISPKIAESLKTKFPELEYFPRGRILGFRPHKKEGIGKILIVSGGTSDMPIVEEARVSAEYMGNCVDVLTDVGIAGLHRLIPALDKLSSARVLIVIAGMEGALPSLIAGLVDRPVIAVPTSTGYGASFLGLAPLLAMLNSCAPGVAVVNIDNGFGAAYIASLINQS